MEETPEPSILKKEIPEVQPIAAEQSPASQAQSANEVETPSQPESKGLLFFLFNPQTRLGRFMRRLVRGLAVFAAIFAIGFLTAYLLLYRPERINRIDAQQQMVSLQQELQKTKSELTGTTADLKVLQERYEAAKAEAEKLAIRIQIASVIQSALEAQNALANRETGIALQSLNSAKTALENLQPAIRLKNPALADDLMTRLQLAISETGRDPRTAQKDLSILVDTLEKVDALFE